CSLGGDYGLPPLLDHW
nr:immunoglobulin heavy chain junction region [Macaca mulatta]MOW85908.1 immunoglobulin heavy chain junction region [Macaca mulatta]